MSITDTEARLVIEKLLGQLEIAQVKSLQMEKEMKYCNKSKGLTVCPCARLRGLLGGALSLVFKA
ncbi:MAG: hypothetical protein ACQEXE_16350 [Bacillota bacterium]